MNASDTAFLNRILLLDVSSRVAKLMGHASQANPQGEIFPFIGILPSAIKNTIFCRLTAKLV